MKRLFIFIMLAGAVLSSFAGLNADQEALRSAIEAGLKSKGYAVERQTDGLKFSKAGATYYVEISPDDSNPMFVRLSRYIKFNDKLKRADVIAKLSNYNSTPGVKAYCKEKNVIITADMFVTSSDQFTGVIDNLLSNMKIVADKLI